MRRNEYSINEVTRMVATYDQLRESVSTRPGRGLYNLARLADLDKALDMLSLDRYRVVLVHGLLGVTQQETAEALRISQQAVGKRFRYGIEDLHFHMNGGQLE